MNENIKKALCYAEPTEFDVKYIQYLIDNFMKMPPNGKDEFIANMADDLPKLEHILNDIKANHIADVERDYILRLHKMVKKSTRLKEKYFIYKFLYWELPIERLTHLLKGKRFRLYDHLPSKEKVKRYN